MKKYQKTIIVVIMLLIAFLAVQIVQAANTAQPGTEFDPLVTKSYVDEQIRLVSQSGKTSSQETSSTGGTVDNQVVENLRTDVKDLTNIIIDAFKEIDDLKRQNQELIEKVNQLESGFIVVELTRGQRLIAGGGSEVIVRSGAATAIGGQHGALADATSGKDVMDGEKVQEQHLLISSRSDGRGLIAEAETVWVLVRGTYTIQ